MHAALLCLAASVLGVDYGWEPVADGSEEVEYIIQIRPQQLKLLDESNQVISNVPKELKVARYRIIVGEDKLPQEPSLEELRSRTQAAARLQKPVDFPEGIAVAAKDRGSPTAASSDDRGREFDRQRAPIRQLQPEANPPMQPIPQREPELAHDPALGREPTPARESAAPRNSGLFDWGKAAIGVTNDDGGQGNRKVAADDRRFGDSGSRPGRLYDDADDTDRATPKKSSADNRRANDDEGPELTQDPLLQDKSDEPERVEPQPLPDYRNSTSEDGRRSTSAARSRDPKPAPKSTVSKSAAPKATTSTWGANTSTGKTAPAKNDAKAAPEKPEPSKPWLLGTLFCTSLAVNGYLGFLAWSERIRSRNLLEKLRTSDSRAD